MISVRLRVLPVLVVLALGATAGCSEEEPVPDDGSQAVPLAGLGAQLDADGVDVVSADVPDLATADEVTQALDDAGVASPEASTPDSGTTDDALALEPTATAGLLSLVADGQETTVVLVFTDPSAAAVFAAGDPDVFDDTALEETREAFLSGNLVGYTGPARGRPARLRAALETLAGA
jgi:hypothetical protein